jgi:hypothetical protein
LRACRCRAEGIARSVVGSWLRGELAALLGAAEASGLPPGPGGSGAAPPLRLLAPWARRVAALAAVTGAQAVARHALPLLVPELAKLARGAYPAGVGLDNASGSAGVQRGLAGDGSGADPLPLDTSSGEAGERVLQELVSAAAR